MCLAFGEITFFISTFFTAFFGELINLGEFNVEKRLLGEPPTPDLILIN